MAVFPLFPHPLNNISLQPVHLLKHNDIVLGLVRMGSGIEYDEHAIEYLNGLFNYLAVYNIIKYPVREYDWQ